LRRGDVPKMDLHCCPSSQTKPWTTYFSLWNKSRMDNTPYVSFNDAACSIPTVSGGPIHVSPEATRDRSKYTIHGVLPPFSYHL